MIEQILEADRMLQVDQVDRARELYQRVVDLDPGNAIAVVGLAQCAVAEGDDQAAYELASRALEIDPENDMARRMESRLAEILATRGEDVERPAAAATPPTQELRPIVTEEATTPSSAKAAAAAAEGSPASPLTSVDDGAAPSTPPAPATAARSSATVRPVMRKSLVDRLLGR